MRSLECLEEQKLPPSAPDRPPRVEIVVPVRDEERDLGPGVRRLAAYLSHRFPFRAMVTIADNGSADGTWAVAQALAGELDGVRAVRLARAGRGPGGGGPGGTGPGGARIPGGGTARGGTGAAGGPPRPVPRRHERDAPGGATGAQRLPAARGQAGGAGGPRGLGGDTHVAAALTRLLRGGAAGYRWAAATVGSESAAPLQLASGDPVMAIGGFNGTDGAPTLAEFQRLVAAGEIHYFVGANQASFGNGSGAAAQITAWVRDRFTAETVGGVTVYDLTRAS